VDSSSALAVIALQAICGGGLVLVAWGWGHGVLAALGIPEDSRQPALALSSGLLVLAQLAFLSAALGAFGRPAVAALALGGLGLAIFGSWRAMASSGFRARDVALLVGAAAVVFALGLYPADAFDEKVYHLPIVRSLVDHGELRWIDHLRFPAFPQLAESLGAALAIASGVPAASDLTARLTHLVQGVALIALCGLILEEGVRVARPRAAWIGCAILVGSPLVLYQASTHYVDLFLTLATTLALLCALRAGGGAPAQPGAAPDGAAWARLAGLAVGSAFAVKYSGAVLGAAVLWTVVAISMPRAARWRAGAHVVLFAALAAAPTATWLWAISGSPLFPFWVGADSPWRPVLAQWAGARWVELLRLPWSMYFDRPAVGWQPPPSPWLPLVAALAFAACRTVVAARLLVIAAALPLLPLAVSSPDVRYLLPSLPLLVLAALHAPVAEAWSRRRAGAWIGGSSLAIGLAYGGWSMARYGPIPWTAAAAEEFQASRNPGLRALRVAEAGADPAPRLAVCGGESLIGLSRGRLYGDHGGRLRQADLVALLTRPEELARRLRELAIHRLVVLRGSVPGFDPADPDLLRHFRLLYDDSEAWVFERL
jgi:hypothetical protein